MFVLSSGQPCGRGCVEGDRCGYHKNCKPLDLPPLKPGQCKGITQRGRRCTYTQGDCDYHDENGKPKHRTKKKRKAKTTKKKKPAGSAAAAQEIECVCRRAPSDFERKAAFVLFGWGDDEADDTVTLGNTRKLKKLIERVVDNCGMYLGVARGKICKFVLQEEEDQSEEEGVGGATAGEPDEEEEGEGKVIKYSQELRDEINHAIAIGDLSAFKSSLASKINLNRIKENSDSAVKK